MKKSLLLFLMSVCSPLFLFADVEKTYNVSTAGNLSTCFDVDKLTITKLTLTGELNGTDLRLIREMAGNDYQGNVTSGQLQELDLSGATIVAGGDAYFDLADNQTWIYLGENQFYGFTDDAKMSVANTFGDFLFAGCQQLKSVKTPNNLTTIGERAFAGSGLTSIELNSGLTTIGYCAFWFTKLSTITIPKTVTNIGTNYWIDNPFAYNDNLTSITLEEGNTRYEMVANSKLLIDNKKNAVVCALGNATIPEDITTIGSNAFCNRPELVNYIIPEGVTTLTNPEYPNIGNNTFSQCANLESIVIPEGITVISNAAFTECPKLNNVTIPSTVTRIGDFAFKQIGLSEITIPANITYIGQEAFAYNQNLTTVISYITNPPAIDASVFAKESEFVNNAMVWKTYPKTLYVPKGKIDAYRTAGWDAYFTDIIELPDYPILTATSYSRVYGEDNPTFEFTTNGGLYTGTPSITCAATATSNVGTYDIVITAGTITDPTVVYVNGTLTINKAPLKISVGNYTKKQGEENPTFSLTYDGFKNNETSAVFTTQPTITCAATKDSPAGTYVITVSGAVAGNYEISYVAGKLTIEAAPTPEPKPEPKGTTFEEDVDDSASNKNAKFTVTESNGSDTPTVSISSDEDGFSGQLEIPETVKHNGVEYKVTEISDGAFQNNTSLTGVTIPASIVSIKENAFAGCTNLKAITIYVVMPINLATANARGLTRADGSSVFAGVDKNTCILYVPEGSVDKYKAAPVWSDFKNILPIKTSTGIQGIEMADSETFDVFTLSGQKVKTKATSLDGLPRGIYIVKGKKVMK